MKLKPNAVVKDNPLATVSTITDKIKKLDSGSAAFNVLEFYSNNKGLVKKFLRKNTHKLKVPDYEEDDVPDSWWYKGRQGLLRAKIKNRTYSLVQKLEWIKCALDPIYFTRKYVKIINIDEGIVNFDLYDYQEEIINLFEDSRFAILKMCRQSGKTTTTASYICHQMIFYENYVGIIAQATGQAQEILERIQMAYELLPLFLQPGVSVYNKRSFTLANSSKALCGAATSTSIRGKSFSLVFIDEISWIKRDMQFYESVYPTISSGKNSRVYMASTPNGMRGLFYKLWTESEQGINSFEILNITWERVPGRDEEWKRETIANTSQEQFDQEQDCLFMGSSTSLLNNKTLENLLRKSPILIDDEGIKVFKEPEDGQEYIMTVDVSHGLGGDYHSFSIVNLTSDPHEVVCTFKNNIMSTLYYPHFIYKYATHFNEAFVLVEINDLGNQVANTLYYDLEYENLLTTTREKATQTIGFTSNESLRMGVRTDKKSKSIGCSNAKELIQKNRITLNDESLINEFGTFVPKGGSYAADSGANDDQVMTIVIYAWAMTQPYFMDLANQDVRKKLINQIKEERDSNIMPFGIIDNGVHDAFDGNFDSDFYEGF